MAITDELDRLTQLHAQGALTDEEFAHAKQRLLQGGGRIHSINDLHRSRTDRWIGGVCGGLAQATGFASWIWRLLMLITLPFFGFGVLLYLILWLVVPLE